MNIPAPAASASIPTIEDGLYVVRFDDIVYRVVEQFKTDKDKYGKADDGGRYDILVTVLDEDRNPVVPDTAEDPSDTLTLRQAKSIRTFSSDDRANSYFYMKGILTPAEFQLWLASTPENPADLSGVAGRHLNAQVSHNEKGWPQVETFVGPAKAKGK